MKPSKDAVVQKRRPGRPATGTDPIVQVRFPADVIAAVDEEAAATGATRSEVIRAHVKEGVRYTLRKKMKAKGAKR